MEVELKGAAVDVDLAYEDVMRVAPAVAWEDSYSERVRFVSPMRDPMRFSRRGPCAPRRRAAKLGKIRRDLFYFFIFLFK